MANVGAIVAPILKEKELSEVRAALSVGIEINSSP